MPSRAAYISLALARSDTGCRTVLIPWVVVMSVAPSAVGGELLTASPPARSAHIRGDYGTAYGSWCGGIRDNGAVVATVEVSAREAEVLALVGERLSNAEIAARLFVSVRTAESHVSSLLRKLDVPDRRALAQRASELAPDRSRPAAVLPTPLTPFVGRAAERAE